MAKKIYIRTPKTDDTVQDDDLKVLSVLELPVIDVDNEDEQRPGSVGIKDGIPVYHNGTELVPFGVGDLTLYQLKSEKGAADGYASLGGDGKVPMSQLPALAVTDTFVASSQSAMLALSADKGDVAVRTDINKSFILTSSPPSTLSNWQELLTPTDAVSSVNGDVGNVNLTTSKIPEGSNLYYTDARVNAKLATGQTIGANTTGKATGTTLQDVTTAGNTTTSDILVNGVVVKKDVGIVLNDITGENWGLKYDALLGGVNLVKTGVLDGVIFVKNSNLNVGIGTVTPTEALSVNGNIQSKLDNNPRKVNIGANGIEIQTNANYSALIKADKISENQKIFQLPNANGTLALEGFDINTPSSLSLSQYTGGGRYTYTGTNTASWGFQARSDSQYYDWTFINQGTGQVILSGQGFDGQLFWENGILNHSVNLNPGETIFAYNNSFHIIIMRYSNQSSGVYLPDVIDFSGASSITPKSAHYAKIGNQVSVNGIFTIAATATAPNAHLSLPIPSIFGVTSDLSGTALSISIPTGVAFILGDPTQNSAYLSMNIPTGTTDIFYNYMYSVI